MGNKTLFIVLMIALSAAVVLQNTGNVPFTFLWAKLTLAQSTITLSALAIGFIAGIVVTRSNNPNDDNSNKNSEDENYLN